MGPVGPQCQPKAGILAWAGGRPAYMLVCLKDSTCRSPSPSCCFLEEHAPLASPPPSTTQLHQVPGDFGTSSDIRPRRGRPRLRDSTNFLILHEFGFLFFLLFLLLLNFCPFLCPSSLVFLHTFCVNIFQTQSCVCAILLAFSIFEAEMQNVSNCSDAVYANNYYITNCFQMCKYFLLCTHFLNFCVLFTFLQVFSACICIFCVFCVLICHDLFWSVVFI